MTFDIHVLPTLVPVHHIACYVIMWLAGCHMTIIITEIKDCIQLYAISSIVCMNIMLHTILFNVKVFSFIEEIITVMSLFTAPTSPPTSVDTSDESSSSITVQWGQLDCMHHNGNITGYSVQYGVKGNGSTQTLDVAGGATTETSITGLDAATTYTIAVAAVNSAGAGVYSTLTTGLTLGTLC